MSKQMRTTTWNTVAEVLADAGCGLVVGLPADAPGLLEAAAEHPALTAVPVRDQRIGPSLAAGWALSTGRCAVFATTTGPGFLNAVTALVETDSVGAPLVVVTTRVAVAELGRGAFQELPQRGYADQFASWHFTVERSEQLSWALRRAVYLAQTPRRGITVVEVAPEALDDSELPDAVRRPLAIPRPRPAEAQIDSTVELLRDAERPVVLLGGGAKSLRGSAALTKLQSLLPAAYVTTGSGRGTLDERNPLACGSTGIYATPPIDALLNETDAVLVVGSRLEETMRAGWDRLADVPLIHIDTDTRSFGTVYEPTVAVLADAEDALAALVDRLAAPVRVAAESAWVKEITEAKRAAVAAVTPVDFTKSPTRVTMAKLNAAFPTSTLVQENGLHDLWGYHHPFWAGDHDFIGPGEQTMMGFSVAAAVGVSLARPDKTVIATCGDGAAAMALAAFPAARHHAGALLYVVWGNGGFGWPGLTRDDDFDFTRFSSPTPVLEAMRLAGGLAFEVTNERELDDAVAEVSAALTKTRVALISVRVESTDLPPATRFA